MRASPMIRVCGTCVLTLLVPVVAGAEDKAPAAKPAAAASAAPAAPPMPKPSADLATFMKGFEGSWKCDTKFAANMFGPGSPEMTVKSTVKIKKDLDGFWYRGDYELKKTKAMPGIKGYFFIGYDPGSNQALITTVDGMGGLATGSGAISGDSVTFLEDGYMGGAKVKSRETMEKKEKGVYHKFEVDAGKGFQLLGEDTCQR